MRAIMGWYQSEQGDVSPEASCKKTRSAFRLFPGRALRVFPAGYIRVAENRSQLLKGRLSSEAFKKTIAV